MKHANPILESHIPELRNVKTEGKHTVRLKNLSPWEDKLKMRIGQRHTI